ncbi:MAG: 50S ribosomal protein L16 [Candidatus Micrarchaeia archaeon]
MGLRPARTVRSVRGPPWTRYSKKKPRKSYVKSMPHKNLNTFETGELKPDYDLCAFLVAKEAVRVRDNAIEAARQMANRHLEKAISGNYKFYVRKYPHEVLRENRMLSGAGADRLSKGMRKSFGKPSDLAARFKAGDVVFEVRTYSANAPLIAQAFRKASQKMSGTYTVKLSTVKKAA